MPDEATTVNPPAPTPAATETPPAATPPVPSTPPTGVITLTREELDRQLADVRRATERNVKGTPEWKSAQDALRQLQEIESRSKSELERERERSTKAEERATAAEGRIADTLRRSAFMTAAVHAGIPADRVEAAYKLADTAAITVGDDGTVGGVDDVIKALPDWLAAPTRPGVPDINAGGGQPTVDQAARDAEIKRKYRLG